MEKSSGNRGWRRGGGHTKKQITLMSPGSTGKSQSPVAVRKHERDARTGQVYVIFPHVHSYYYPTRDTMTVSVPGWARRPTPAKQLANFTESSLVTRPRWTYLEIAVSSFPADRGKLCDLHMSELEPPGKP